jgi:hypothetical protein
MKTVFLHSAGGMTQVVGHLSSKREALCSNFSTAKNQKPTFFNLLLMCFSTVSSY